MRVMVSSNKPTLKIHHPNYPNRFARIGVMFGLQNIPWICKASKYGHAARYVHLSIDRSIP